MQRLKIIFAGTPAFAAEYLRVLLDKAQHDVVAVYTQPDRPSGRGKKLTASPVKMLAATQEMPIYQPLSLKDKATQQQIAELNADIMVVVAYGLIVPKSVLTMLPLGCINVHASLLPRWRGAAPIQRAIEAGDEQTGITIMQMDEGLDTGPALSRVPCAITETDSAASLQARLAVAGASAMLKALDAFADPDNQPIAEPQDDALATYAHKITKEEARLDWALPALALSRKVRAFNPAPVAFTTLNNLNLRIWRASVIARRHEALPGTILSCAIDGILVACRADALLLTEVQLAGKKPMAVGSLLQGRGALFAPGTVLGT